MPPIYAVVSFFSYRFFREYTYYSLSEASTLTPSLRERFLAHPHPLHSVRGVWQMVNLEHAGA
jgi:hypothetical protein